MKKIFILILSIAMILVLCACNGTEGVTTPKEETNLYEAFLNGEANLFGDKYGITFWDGENDVMFIDSVDGYSLYDVVTRINQSSYMSPLSLTEINKTYIDCGSDGVPELVVEFVLVDEYEDTLTKDIIIKEIDGKLQLCYMTESYYRYFEYIVSNAGVIFSGGSGGASSFAQCYSVLDAEGKSHTIYYEDGEYSLGAYYAQSEELQKAAENHLDEINEESLLRTITFYDENEETEETIYGADPEDDELTIQIFKEAGVELTSSEEIERMIQERFDAYGASREEGTLEWSAVDLDAVGLSDVVKYGFNTVFVENVDELVAAVNDYATIVLAPGTYNLTEWLNEHDDAVEVYCEQTADAIKGVCKTSFEDPEFGIANISGMTLVSQDETNPAHIVSEPRYCHVINFCECGGNTLKNLIIGHTPEPGSCSGDVLAFNSGYGARIIGCDLYGCGAYGIFADYSGNIQCTNTTIHDCTYGLIEGYNGSYFGFDNCTFKDCEGYNMIVLLDGSSYFQNCSFKNLNSNMLYLGENSYVNFYNCMFDAACAEAVNSYNGEGTVNVY